jgi:hypothetical protein
MNCDYEGFEIESFEVGRGLYGTQGLGARITSRS